MDAEDRSAPIECRNGSADRCRVGADFRRRIADHAGQGALAREPDEDRASDAADAVEPADQLEVLVGRLAEADARVEADVILGDPGTHRDGEPLLEETGDLLDDVVVMRRNLHRAEALPACA